MILKGKKILIMGIRNKWSIAYGIAKSAYEHGAKLMFTFVGEDNRSKMEELLKEFEGSKLYTLDDASEDELVKDVFTKIKEENGKIDGITISPHTVRPNFTAPTDFCGTSKMNNIKIKTVIDKTIIFPLFNIALFISHHSFLLILISFVELLFCKTHIF